MKYCSDSLKLELILRLYVSLDYKELSVMYYNIRYAAYTFLHIFDNVLFESLFDVDEMRNKDRNR